MSLTILAGPAQYSSVHDDLVYTVSEPTHTADPVTYPNYKFIGDVYIGGVLIARIKKIPDPLTQIGIFNVGQIVRNYLTTLFNPTGSVLVAQTLGDGQFSVTVTMKFGEEYNGTSFTALVSDSPRTFFNNYNGRLVGVTSSLSAFTNKLATNRPATVSNVFQTSNYSFISYFPTSTSPVSYTITPIGAGVGFSGTIIPTNAYELEIINVAPGALNVISPGCIISGTTGYTVTIGSQTYTFNVICEAVYTPYTLHFLNQYGGFESKIFTKVSRKTYAIEKKDFGKLRYTVDGAGAVTYKNANNVYNEGRSVYSSQFTEKLLLNSDFLTDGEYSWLAELILSPMVYVEDGGYFFPCVISESNYEFKKAVNDDLTNLSLSIEYGQQLSAQYR
jgi:hypothetical protein